jgi:hypothetical protein
MKPEVEVMSGERKRVPGQDFDFDCAPTLEKPLVIEVRMLEDRPSFKDVEIWRKTLAELYGKANGQGCTCTPFSRAIWQEYLLVEANYYLENNRTKSKWSTVSLPRCGLQG